MTTDPVAAMPDRVALGDALELRRATTAHAGAVARAVAESLEHLRPFMPWANADAGKPAVQHHRLQTSERAWTLGREYQYVIVATAPGDGTSAPGDDAVVGMIGASRPDRWDVGRDTVELGYWVHVDWCGRGIATRAARALARAALALEGVERVVITVDTVNDASNAVPRRLGYGIEKVVVRTPAAPGETGHMQVWVGGRPAGARLPQLFEHTLSDDQLALLESIASNRGSAGKRPSHMVGPDGAIRGPYNHMLLAPDVGGPLQELGGMLLSSGSLDDLTREIVILMVARAERSEFPWWGHLRIARAAGLTDHQLDALRAGEPPVVADDDEQVAVAAAHAIVTRGDLGDAEFDETLAAIGPAALVELTTLIGYYTMLATQLRVFRVGAPDAEPRAFD
jgi:RimJ/RimL family protein N-acetyltransferase